MNVIMRSIERHFGDWPVAQKKPLPPSELELLQIVWDLGEASVRQVEEALPADRGLDFWTVQTYLRRLKAKGYLKVRRDGRTNIYRPSHSRERVLADVVDEFVNRVFSGEALPLFQHLIDGRRLSARDVEQLQEKLDEMKRRK
jgi:predicted transcriptional regulator